MHGFTLSNALNLDFFSILEDEAQAVVGLYAHLFHCAIPQRFVERCDWPLCPKRSEVFLQRATLGDPERAIRFNLCDLIPQHIVAPFILRKLVVVFRLILRHRSVRSNQPFH